jgi:hypothetical protein
MAKKRPFNYIAAMATIKGKVSFNYRNQSNETLTRGRKSAIKRAFNDLQDLKTTELVRPSKNKGESKSAFKRRVSRLKKAYGQSGNSLFGVAIAVPPGAKATVKNGLVMIKGTGTKNKISELVLPVNKQELINDTLELITSIIMQYRPDVIWGFHSSWRSNTGVRLFYDDSSELDEIIEEFSEGISNILAKYTENENVMTGFVLQFGTGQNA